jgi:hypothetical protein
MTSHTCILCNRRINKFFYYTDKGTSCLRCTDTAHHAEVYPDCPTTWHDMYDHIKATP